MSSPSPLSEAALSADLAAIRTLLAAGAAADGEPGEAAPPLHLACGSEASAAARLAAAQALLDAGASPRHQARDRTTPVHVAARRGPLALVELLIRHGDATWVPDENGHTALHHARSGTAPDKAAIVELLDRPVIRDPVFRAAVTAVQTGDLAALNRLLDARPSLLHERPAEPDCYARDYFRDPRLLWFVANNPTLMPRMPANIVAVAEAMIARGAAQEDLDYTLELVMTSAEAREQGHQAGLIAALLEAGARASHRAIVMTLAHWETEPVRLLLARGMALTAPIAAGLGRTAELGALLPAATPEERQEAFGLAVINRHTEAARLCLDAGAAVNAFLPVHKHSTALHQAVANDDRATMALLLERGAALDIADTLWDATPLDWALHQGKAEAAAMLRAAAAR